MTMSYIIFVQPAVLSTTGMDFNGVLAATCILTALGCFLMAFLANYPIAVAPAMGHNFFFAFTVVAAMKFTWQVALGAVFISGILFLLMSIWGVRETLMEAIPESLKRGIAAGIGLLITLIGLEWSGLVTANPGTLVALGELNQPPVWMAGTGLLVTGTMLVRRVRGAILAGILTSAAVGFMLGVTRFHGFISAPPSIAPVAFKLDIAGALTLGAIPVIFTFFFLDLFDSIGSLVGIAEQGGFLQNGKLPRAREALMADAIGTSAAGLLGNSTLVSYIESAAGVAEGGRTGLANIVTGLLMLAGLFFSPLAQTIGEGYKTAAGATIYPTVAPALIVVGAFMMRGLGRIAWTEPADFVPAFMTMTFIPFTFSITDGIAFGFIAHTVLAIASGRARKLHWLMVAFTALFIVRYAVV
jgi:AGZA family xanthine/uracil permease-like MFS transporter